MADQEKQFECDLHVSVGEIRQEMGADGIEKLEKKIEKAGVEVTETVASAYGGEVWTLRGPLKGLKKIASLVGYDAADISFEEI